MTTKLTIAAVGIAVLMATLMSACIDSNETATENNVSVVPTPNVLQTPEPTIAEDDSKYTSLIMRLAVSANIFVGNRRVDGVMNKTVIEMPYTTAAWNREITPEEFAQMTGLEYSGVYLIERTDEQPFTSQKRGSVSGRWDTDVGHIKFTGSYSLIRS